jgi:hypothetical protein
MFILLHVLIALSSVGFTGYTSFFPSKNKITFSYALVALTIGTGTYLIISRPAHMIATCFEGLVYIGVVTIGIIFAQRKLASSNL